MEKRKKDDLIRESESTKSARIQVIILISGLIIALLIYVIGNWN